MTAMPAASVMLAGTGADDDPSSRTRRTHSSSRSNHQAPSLRKPRARLPHSVNVPKRTFTPFGLLRLQNPQQRPANGASSNEQPSEPTRIVDVERQKYLTPNRRCPAPAAPRPAAERPYAGRRRTRRRGEAGRGAAGGVGARKQVFVAALAIVTAEGA